MKDTEKAAAEPSDAMRRVVEALLEGQPAPPDAQAALTEAERAEVAALARTSHFAAVTLRRPDAPPEAEAASLSRAQQALANRPPTTPLPDEETRPFWQVWWDRLAKREKDTEDGA